MTLRSTIGESYTTAQQQKLSFRIRDELLRATAANANSNSGSQAAALAAQPRAQKLDSHTPALTINGEAFELLLDDAEAEYEATEGNVTSDCKYKKSLILMQNSMQ